MALLQLKRSVKADKETALRDFTHGGRKLRHELKFVIDEGTYRMLKARLLALMSPDPHGENGEYRVTSVYFDDIYDSGYNDKLAGIETRRKFRVRTYSLDPSVISLEAKHKDGEYVSKLSNRMTREQYDMLLGGDCSFMKDHDDAEDAFGEYYRSDKLCSLRPKVIVDYHRDALVYPYGNVRITFDKMLSTCYNTVDMLSENAMFSLIYPKEIILEVKFDRFIPTSIWTVLQGLNASRQSVSKYIICCDRLTEVKGHGF